MFDFSQQEDRVEQTGLCLSHDQNKAHRNLQCHQSKQRRWKIKSLRSDHTYTFWLFEMSSHSQFRNLTSLTGSVRCVGAFHCVFCASVCVWYQEFGFSGFLFIKPLVSFVFRVTDSKHWTNGLCWNSLLPLQEAWLSTNWSVLLITHRIFAEIKQIKSVSRTRFRGFCKNLPLWEQLEKSLAMQVK